MRRIVPMLLAMFFAFSAGAVGCHCNKTPPNAICMDCSPDGGGPPTDDAGPGPAPDAPQAANDGVSPPPPDAGSSGRCKTDDDCSDRHWCENTYCLPCLDGTCVTQHCEWNAECRDGEICIYPHLRRRRAGWRLGYCVGPICGDPLPDGAYYRCNWFANCPYEWGCYIEYNFCLPFSGNCAAHLGPDGEGTTDCNDPPCETDEDCAPDRYCNPFAFCQKDDANGDSTDGCQPDDGQTCQVDADCRKGDICVETKSGTFCMTRPADLPCDNDLHCAEGLICNDARCQTPPPAQDGGPTSDGGRSDDGGYGVPCEVTEDCRSGLVCREVHSLKICVVPPVSGGDEDKNRGGRLEDGGETPDGSNNADGDADPGDGGGLPNNDGGEPHRNCGGGSGCTLQPDCPDDQECQGGICIPLPPCEEDSHSDHHGGRFMCHGHYPDSGNQGVGVIQGHVFHCRCPAGTGSVRN